ncbi:MAG: cysteine hydrolase [Phycisphaerae bacterium]|nr:cysteine hydrolase [Phycisphaerae bacterium]
MQYERIVLDVETQRDFFLPSGSLYTVAADEAARNINRLFEWVRANNIPVMSTVLRVRPFERGPMGERPHCVDGTNGEKKLPRTVLPRRVNLGLLNSTDLPGDLFGRYQQVIFEKRDTDIFAHARAERLLTELRGSTFILCGAGVSQGLVQAAVGLRTRGFGVIVAEDAILDFGHPRADMARLRMQAKGAIFAPTVDIIATPIPPRQRAFRTAAEKKVT